MGRTRAARAYDAGYVAIYRAGVGLIDTPRPTTLLAEFMRRHRLRGGRAVEFGCGEGRDAIFLAKRGFRVVAFDTSKAALARARRRALEQGIGIRFRVGDMAGPFGFRDASIDLAVTIDSFHYVTAASDRARHFREVFRILKDGGLYFFCNHVARRASRGRGGGMETVVVRLPRGEARIRVPRVPYFVGTKAVYVRAFQEAGFVVRTARVTRSFPIRAPAVLIVAEKPAGCVDARPHTPA